jgi:hypothetical protein
MVVNGSKSMVVKKSNLCSISQNEWWGWGDLNSRHKRPRLIA